MTKEEKDQIIFKIARRVLGFQTLEARRRDYLDFKSVAVWSVREALEAAFQAGLAAANGNAPKTDESEAG